MKHLNFLMFISFFKIEKTLTSIFHRAIIITDMFTKFDVLEVCQNVNNDGVTTSIFALRYIRIKTKMA